MQSFCAFISVEILATLFRHKNEECSVCLLPTPQNTASLHGDSMLTVVFHFIPHFSRATPYLTYNPPYLLSLFPSLLTCKQQSGNAGDSNDKRNFPPYFIFFNTLSCQVIPLLQGRIYYIFPLRLYLILMFCIYYLSHV